MWLEIFPEQISYLRSMMNVVLQIARTVCFLVLPDNRFQCDIQLCELLVKVDSYYGNENEQNICHSNRLKYVY